MAENERVIIQLLEEQQEELFQTETKKQQVSCAVYENDTYLGGATASIFGNTLHLSLLAVKKSARKQGIGTLLMNYIEKEAQNYHCTYITVNTQDYQARQFYERFGFSVFGEIKDTPFEGTTKYYLKKERTQ